MMDQRGLKVLKKVKLAPAARGMDYCKDLDLLAVTCEDQVHLVTPGAFNSETFDSLHGCPALVRFSTRGSDTRVLVSDNEGPIDVIDVETKGLIRSYLEHGDRVTGLDWTSETGNTSFVSCSKDFTVKFYAANEPHSLATLQMQTGVCGVHWNPYITNQVVFGTTKGKFYIYDIRKMSIPYLEVKAHEKTVSNVLFLSECEILSMGTDSCVKLWDARKTVCTRKFIGHVHHSFFTGVDYCENLIALGGEDSAIRVYKKDFSNFVASQQLSVQKMYICGCAWLPTYTVGKTLVTVDNHGYLHHLLFN